MILRRGIALSGSLYLSLYDLSTGKTGTLKLRTKDDLSRLEGKPLQAVFLLLLQHLHIKKTGTLSGWAASTGTLTTAYTNIREHSPVGRAPDC